MQIFQTSNDISSPQKLADIISNEGIARYREIPDEQRKLWLGTQIYALCLILHYQPPTAQDVEIDVAFGDQMIMEDKGLSGLKQVEMQEAFRHGIAREYGEFYGVTASSLIGFLRAYRRSEKRMKAVALLYDKEKKRRQEAERERWKALYEARERGVKIPRIAEGRKVGSGPVSLGEILLVENEEECRHLTIKDSGSYEKETHCTYCNLKRITISESECENCTDKEV